MAKIEQRFTMAEMKRSEIAIAGYNPRKIEEEPRKGLKKELKRHGLVEPPIVNKRTGNLVSGHQRLSIMDEERKGEDYPLMVAVIDVDLKTEKEINIAINNGSIQGDYDPELLRPLLLEIDPVDVGFSVNDLNVFDIEMLDAKEAKKTASKESEETLEDMKAAKKATRELKRLENDLEYSDARLLVVICDSVESKESLLESLGLDALTKHMTEKTFRKLTGRPELSN
jgi:ParB-like chromosome segregation protein Spo0J